MKKVIFTLYAFFSLSIFAQENANAQADKSDLYAVSVNLETVAAYKYGYKVSYKSYTGQTKYLYLPIQWFLRAGAGLSTQKYENYKDDPSLVMSSKAYSNRKGVLFWLKDSIGTPSLVVYYKGGEFSHVVLRISSVFNDSWRFANLPNDWTEEANGPYPLEDVDTALLQKKFEQTKDVKLEF